ncbi:acetate--CoA ligase family protein [Shimia abyssi]|uniref:Acetyl-CoA synthetase n=1 Tax=Shimia abyssi TaxID=1662395 RepID=A0A2P8F9J9_9RHOB|nr:acetate--CoA ligase family protein [Shimia abyssi]PSL18375.1 acetyl-CoA synthetase [Shimia abyssi]
MMHDLRRLLHPKSVAVIGGGAWCGEVVRQLRKLGFSGAIWPVHPRAEAVGGVATFAALEDLPAPPDAAFVGINRHASVEAVRRLAGMGAGGAVCFASGFSEAATEDAGAVDLQAELTRAAGQMPILGPNCYGLINALDGVAIWPDQHGCARVERGVAILTQSSNIAINLTNQRRGVPISYVATCGNMAQLSQAEIARALLDDERVTAIGLHVEGFSELRGWEAFARAAYEKSVPVVVLKVGASEQAQAATVSHTASLAGSDAGADALIARLGFARVRDLPVFLETLKLLHMVGPLASTRVASISCSGGEASLMADTAAVAGLAFPTLTGRQRAELAEVLGPMVALANPLDYHTYIWRDAEKMAHAWGAMTDDGTALTMSVVDYPHEERMDWDCATKAAIQARAKTGRPFAVVSSLPELMPGDVAETLIAGGVVPFFGLYEAAHAVSAAARIRAPEPMELCLPGVAGEMIMSEAGAKAELAGFGVDVPKRVTVGAGEDIVKAAEELRPPLVLKGQGIAHKTEAEAVRVGVMPEGLVNAANDVPCETFLVEEMISGGVAELLVGVTRDPAHGFVLTLAAGGVLTELLEDRVSVLVPSDRESVKQALFMLKTAKLLSGFRGAEAANLDVILDCVDAIQNYVIANSATLSEAEINPLICTPERAVAVDALIRKGENDE